MRDLSLPHGTALVSLQHGSQLVFPSGDTVLAAGQTVSVLVRKEEEAAVRALFTAATPAPSAGPS